MKNFTLQCIVLIGLFGAMHTFSFAQSLPNGILPEIGDTVESTFTEGDDVDEGLSGNGVTWDYSTMTPGPLSEPTISMYVDPEDTPFAADFPTANLALVTPIENGNSYSYYMVANNRLEYVGGESNGTFINYQADPQLYLDANLSAGNPVLDTYEGITNTAGTMVYTKGESTADIDASGTLLLPAGSYGNAVRMLQTMERVDSLGDANFSAVTTLQITSYIWFVPGQKDAVMAIVYTEGESVSTVMGNPPVITAIPPTRSVVYNPNPVDNPSAVAELAAVKFAGLSPNPASHQTTLELEVESPMEVTIVLSNVMGENLWAKQSRLVPGMNQERIDLSDQSPGNYFVSVYNEKGISSYQLIKITP